MLQKSLYARLYFLMTKELSRSNTSIKAATTQLQNSFTQRFTVDACGINIISSECELTSLTLNFNDNGKKRMIDLWYSERSLMLLHIKKKKKIQKTLEH